MAQRKKVVVIGCKGMAGHVIKTYLESTSKYEVWGVARGGRPEKRIVNLDVSNIHALENILADNMFDVVINCIGLLNTKAEDSPELAIWYNSYFPQLLATFGEKFNYKLVHISTDCVFSGKDGGYVEDSFKDGIGFYAQSKALGEVLNTKDLTFRTSIIGPELKKDGIGLFHWFMNQKYEVYGFNEAYWSGVTTIELAKGIDEAIQQNLTGLFHLVNNIKISKHDLIIELNQIFKDGKIKVTPTNDYKVDKSLINTRTDFNYVVPDYNLMLLEMRDWIVSNSKLYSQYNLNLIK